MKKIIITFGLIAGAIMSIMLVVSATLLEDIVFDQGAVFGYASMVLAMLLVYFGVRTYRDTVRGGSVKFLEAARAGLGIVAIATVFYAISWEFVYRYVWTDFTEKMVAHQVGELQKAGAPAATIEAKRKEMREFAVMYQNPLVRFGFTLLEPLPVGLLAVVISAGVLSRKRRDELSQPVSAVS